MTAQQMWLQTLLAGLPGAAALILVWPAQPWSCQRQEDMARRFIWMFTGFALSLLVWMAVSLLAGAAAPVEHAGALSLLAAQSLLSLVLIIRFCTANVWQRLFFCLCAVSFGQLLPESAGFSQVSFWFWIGAGLLLMISKKLFFLLSGRACFAGSVLILSLSVCSLNTDIFWLFQRLLPSFLFPFGSIQSAWRLFEAMMLGVSLLVSGLIACLDGIRIRNAEKSAADQMLQDSTAANQSYQQAVHQVLNDLLDLRTDLAERKDGQKSHTGQEEWTAMLQRKIDQTIHTLQTVSRPPQTGYALLDRVIDSFCLAHPQVKFSCRMQTELRNQEEEEAAGRFLFELLSFWSQKEQEQTFAPAVLQLSFLRMEEGLIVRCSTEMDWQDEWSLFTSQNARMIWMPVSGTVFLLDSRLL